ncbi:unnamed protein product [Penicillium glandicola]
MKDTVAWLSLLATGFALVTTGHSSLIDGSVALSELEDGLSPIVRVGVTLWLGDGESCTPETVTETSTETGNTSPSTAAITITEATTQTVSGCRSGPTLNVNADIDIGLVEVSAGVAIGLPGIDGHIKTITDYTTEILDNYVEALDNYVEALDNYVEALDNYVDNYVEALDNYVEALDNYVEALDNYLQFCDND